MPLPRSDDPRSLHYYPPRPSGIGAVAFDAGYWLCRARFAIAPILLRWYNARDALRDGYGNGRRTAVWELHDDVHAKKAAE